MVNNYFPGSRNSLKIKGFGLTAQRLVAPAVCLGHCPEAYLEGDPQSCLPPTFGRMEPTVQWELGLSTVGGGCQGATAPCAAISGH